jgi:hypothetical protein
MSIIAEVDEERREIWGAQIYKSVTDSDVQTDNHRHIITNISTLPLH